MRRKTAVGAGAALLIAVLSACTAGSGDGGSSGAATASGPATSSDPTTASTSGEPAAGDGCPDDLSAESSVDCLATATVDAVVGRLSLMPDLAAATAAEDPGAEVEGREAEAVRAFVTEAVAGGVPRSTARAVIRDQVAAATNVQRALLDGWADGTLEPPEGEASDPDRLEAAVDAATVALADALVVVWAAGVPDGWGSEVADAQGRALPTLPDGVTAVDLALALSTLSDLG